MEFSSIIGTWVDEKGSQYAVELDKGENTCTLTTTRPNGAQRVSRRFLKLSDVGQVLWPAKRFNYRLEVIGCKEVRWARSTDKQARVVWRRTSDGYASSTTASTHDFDDGSSQSDVSGDHVESLEGSTIDADEQQPVVIPTGEFKGCHAYHIDAATISAAHAGEHKPSLTHAKELSPFRDIVGTWIDEGNSRYKVQVDANVNTCTVTVTRPDGAVRTQKQLFRLTENSTIVWPAGATIFVPDVQTKCRIIWRTESGGYGFTWSRVDGTGHHAGISSSDQNRQIQNAHSKSKVEHPPVHVGMSDIVKQDDLERRKLQVATRSKVHHAAGAFGQGMSIGGACFSPFMCIVGIWMNEDGLEFTVGAQTDSNTCSVQITASFGKAKSKSYSLCLSDDGEVIWRTRREEYILEACSMMEVSWRSSCGTSFKWHRRF
eukprot:TRINITY_DN1894_c0_g1_i2.p1 TRINITY_DN1894_c0_g1~~TRINITY_DN1894_c0_g1_i2.p1  ORF type:complete len:431 (+),score=52.87 TRINITY_DN1894_c0_g1_i2:70-1362(+)